jgi:uncharacterized protein YndB with AHSA1/START domain
MTVRKDDAVPVRFIEFELEVPGTPEQVWQAIATGPGITSWFVPTEMELGKDGKPTQMTLHFGPGMDSTAQITAYDPPHRLAAEDSWGPGSPMIATEWTVEAKGGGTCVVRVVHSLFAETDDWDGQLEGVENGWPTFFRILRIYLTDFRGQHAATMQSVGMAASDAEGWPKLLHELGIEGAAPGARVEAASSAPPLAGKIELVSDHPTQRGMLVRVTEPAPGVASLGAYACGGPVQTMISFYLFGEQGQGAVKRDASKWETWMGERFPMPQG